jgi:putative sterol carrier protein
VSIGAVQDADIVVETDMDTFFGLANGELALRDAVASGVARAEGDPAAINRCFRVLSIASRVTAAA